jgi:Flp pilus assembly pilin Flp
MIRSISGFLRREEGQDLADYCLLTALVALVAAGILFQVSGGLEGLWNVGNRNLNTANSVVQNNGMSGSPNR